MRKIHYLAILGASLAQANAATIVTGDVTANLGPDFFFDAAVVGGNDFGINQSGTALFDRSFGTLNLGAAGTTITVTGIGWASLNSAAANDATSASVTITYLGLDGIFGGTDDVLIGSVSDDFSYVANGEYYWKFDSALTQTIDGLNNQFRIAIAPTNAGGNGSLSFKTTSGSAADAVKLSVAGTSAALIPEPSSALLGGLGLLALLRRRR